MRMRMRMWVGSAADTYVPSAALHCSVTTRKARRYIYTESDLDSAVQAGVLSPEAASALRAHVATLRATPLEDEEHFRLLTGFNDVFVAISLVLVLGALGSLLRGVAGPAAAAVAAWLLAEYFTRRRSMALPSILLHLAFVGAVSLAVARLPLYPQLPFGSGTWPIVASAAAAVAASLLHWRRFQVPIAIAVLVGSGLATAIGLLAQAVPGIGRHIGWLLLGSGVVCFAAAMAWDMRDPQRQTSRSDVAFWLHLLAAPLIVHSVFSLTGLTQGAGSGGHALAVLVAYLALGALALAVDRRALMVSSLAYVLYAFSSLFREYGFSASLALTALLIGSVLLLLSAVWAQARAGVLRAVPARWRGRLPPVCA